MGVMLEPKFNLNRDTIEKDIYVRDPYFGDNPDFESHQVLYRKVGRTLVTLIENTEHIGFRPEEAEIVERIFVEMMVIDHMIDTMKLEKSKVVDMVVHANSPAATFNNSLSHLRKLIEKNGDYGAYIQSATRAISYSGIDSIKDRHREALHLGKTIALAVCKDDVGKRSRLVNILGILSSFGNFIDDVMDYKKDSKNISWATGRMGVVLREVRKLYEKSEYANRYLFTGALIALSIYGRRLLPSFLKQTPTFESKLD